MLSRTIRKCVVATGLVAVSAAVLAGCRNGKNPDNPNAGIGPGGGPFARGAAQDLAFNPPEVESATVQPTDAADAALLEVKFVKGNWDPAKGVRIVPDGNEVLLKDDGTGGDAQANDGVFSARVPFDWRELAADAAAAQQRVASLAPRAVFRGREIVGVEDVETQRRRIGRASKFRDVETVLRERTKVSLIDLLFLVDPSNIDPARSLMVTDPAVVQDPARTVDPCTGAGNPDGVWTFKHLVTEMTAGTGVDPADFVERWLGLWASNQPVSSGFVAAPRAAMKTKVLDPWPRTAAGKLDLNQSPFRLSAIVNRIDLGGNTVYGGGNAGEGRFVFGVRDRAQGGCVFMPFSVIFEYGVPKRGCHDVKDWARQWVKLSTLPIGTPAYNAALEQVTEQFAKGGVAVGKPNGSALNQLRTNENGLNPLWELREFQIDKASHLLAEVTTKQTPDATLDNTAALANYINANAGDITLEKHVVPDRFPGSAPFMAATARATGGQLDTHFKAPGVNNDARFHLSLNTCAACHIRETGTNGSPGGNNAFLHVDPRPMPAKLSRFLTGATPSVSDTPDPFNVTDPVVPGTTHAFNDLDRRRQKLAVLAGNRCLPHILVPPRQLVERIPRINPGDPPPKITDPRLDGINDPIRMTH